MYPKQMTIFWKAKKNKKNVLFDVHICQAVLFAFAVQWLHSTKCMGNTYANHSLPNKISTYVFKTENCFSPFLLSLFSHFCSRCWCSFMLFLSYSQYQSGDKFEWICRMVCNWNRSIHSFNNIKITIVTYVFVKMTGI